MSNIEVVLVGPYPPDRFESIERFADCLNRELSGRLPVRCIRPAACFSRFAPRGGAASKWLGYADKFLLFPRRLRAAIAQRNAIVHLCDQSAAVHAPSIRGAPCLLTCNDLIAIRAALGEFPEHPTRWTGRRLQRRILEGIRSVRRIACISNATRRDLIRVASVHPENIELIPMGLHRPFARLERALAETVISRSVPRSPFILHVGGNQWYKNRLGVVRIHQELSRRLSPCPNLVIVGAPLSREMVQFVNANRLAVFSVSGCDDDTLRAFYSAAELLLFPSLQEGFGWPIIEAQACGCPVVTSNREPMTEVAGASAEWIDPLNAAQAAETVRSVLAEPPARRAERVRAGLENARRFSTERMIAHYLRVYEQISSGPASRSPCSIPCADAVAARHS